MVRAGDYVVESIPKDKIKGSMRAFRSKAAAIDYARRERNKGRAVAIDLITQSGQRPVLQAGLGENKKFKGSKFNKDFNAGALKKKRMVRKSQPKSRAPRRESGLFGGLF